MKILKSLILSFILVAVTHYVNAQTWTTVNAVRGNFNFNLPSGYSSMDTLNTLFYNKSVDTLLSLQVHYIGGVNIGTTDSVWTVLLSQNNGDTLRAMGGYMLLLTNGQLASIQNLNPINNNPKGIEISIVCPGETAENNILHSRLYYKSGLFYAFTAISVQSDIVRLGTYKTTFFNSVNFAIP